MQVAVYRNSDVYFEEANFTSSHNIAPSMCFTNCPACAESDDVTFAFLEGDTYLLGIVSIHEADPDCPFNCSVFRATSFDVGITESFLHTTHLMRSETGINYGAILLDDCYSSALIELVLTGIMSRQTTLRNPNTGEVIDVGKIAAVISTVGSTVTILASLLMKEFNIPIIASSATSPDLDDRINFPYFLRTVPSDVEQGKAMVDVVKRLGWEYISVMYVKNNYGNKGKVVVEQFARLEDICVAKETEGISDVIDDDTISDLGEVATRLNNHKTDMVIYFGTNTMIEQFLAVSQTNSFVFLGSEDWGDNPYTIETGGDATLGSLTMKNEAYSPADNKFTDYLRNATPANVPGSRNPWFAQYWEEHFKCDLRQTITNKYHQTCTEGATLDEETVNTMSINQRVLHLTEAVRSVTIGLKRAKDAYCNFEPEFPCPNFFNYIHLVVDILKGVKVTRRGEDVRVFNDDGNGNVGFIITNIQRKNDGKLAYVDVSSVSYN